MSLRLKFLFFLVTIPSLSLLAFLYIAYSVFVDDKVTSIFDTSQRNLEQLADFIQSDWAQKQANARIIRSAAIKKVRLDEFDLDPVMKSTGLIQIWDFTRGSDFKIALGKNILPQKNRTYQVVEKAEKLIAEQNIESLFFSFNGRNYFFKPLDNFIMLFTLEGPVSQTIKDTELYSVHLSDVNGNLLVSSKEDQSKKTISEVYGSSLFDRIQNSNFSVETFEAPGGGGPNIYAFYFIKSMDMLLVSSISKDMALRSSLIFLWKSAGTLLVIISIAVLLSILLSTFLTMNITKLKNAMERVGKGHLDTQVQINSSDELGKLGKYFNKFVKTLSALVKESEDKAVLEKDLEIAQTVQETLLPPPDQSTHIGVSRSYYQPAQYCGGDWWFTYERNGKIVYMIGDATGHGVSAALTTAAARAAVSLVSLLDNTDPSYLMTQLNRAISETTKGKVNMTFIVSVFDKETMKMTYTNASHEAIFYAREDSFPLKAKSLDSLHDIHGPRLGENPDSEYSSSTVDIISGDLFVFYTDGFFELTNQVNKPVSEGQFIRLLVKELNKKRSVELFVDNFVAEILAPHGTKPLHDDLAFIALKLS